MRIWSASSLTFSSPSLPCDLTQHVQEALPRLTIGCMSELGFNHEKNEDFAAVVEDLLHDQPGDGCDEQAEELPRLLLNSGGTGEGVGDDRVNEN